MTSASRKRRYWGMTAGQIGLVAAVAVINGAILLIGLMLVLSPQDPDPALAAAPPLAAALPTPTATAVRLPPTWTPTAIPTARPTRAPLPTATVVTRVPRPTVERPNIAIWDELNSYRLQLNMRFGTDSGAKSMQWKITYEWVKEPEAAHMVLAIDGTGLPAEVAALKVESIQVGATTWTRMGSDWEKSTTKSTPALSNSWADVEDLFRGMKPVGEETINGLPCKHYVFDDNVGGLGGLGSAQTQVRAEGDLWIAAQADLPPVPVRVRLKLHTADLFSMLPTGLMPTQQPSKPADVMYEIELDVMDINRPITIRPPL